MQKENEIKTADFNHTYFENVYSVVDSNDRPWVTGCVDINILNLIKNGRISNDTKVLDIGCGYGTEAIAIALQGAKVIGIDLNNDAVTTAQKIASSYKVPVKFMQGDALNLPFKSEEFDLIIDQGCFHHILPDDRIKYAEQVANVLSKGGLFALRGFSDWIEPGTGPQSPFRLKSREILETFLPFFECEEFYRFRSLPRKNKTRWFWWTLWKKI